MDLHDLEVYRLARKISKDAWKLYEKFDWRTKKIIGDQWITAIDSVAANIAEAFGRYHYLDKNKFHFNARGSIFEAMHWTEVLNERGKISTESTKQFNSDFNRLAIKLNNFIAKIRKDASNNKSPRNHNKSL